LIFGISEKPSGGIFVWDNVQIYFIQIGKKIVIITNKQEDQSSYVISIV
jgi:hypothetical protein